MEKRRWDEIREYVKRWNMVDRGEIASGVSSDYMGDVARDLIEEVARLEAEIKARDDMKSDPDWEEAVAEIAELKAALKAKDDETRLLKTALLHYISEENHDTYLAMFKKEPGQAKAAEASDGHVMRQGRTGPSRPLSPSPETPAPDCNTCIHDRAGIMGFGFCNRDELACARDAPKACAGKYYEPKKAPSKEEENLGKVLDAARPKVVSQTWAETPAPSRDELIPTYDELYDMVYGPSPVHPDPKPSKVNK